MNLQEKKKYMRSKPALVLYYLNVFAKNNYQDYGAGWHEMTRIAFLIMYILYAFFFFSNKVFKCYWKCLDNVKTPLWHSLPQAYINAFDFCFNIHVIFIHVINEIIFTEKLSFMQLSWWLLVKWSLSLFPLLNKTDWSA